MKVAAGPYPPAVGSDAVRGVKNCAPLSGAEANKPHIAHKQTMSTRIMDVEHTIPAELYKKIPGGAVAPAAAQRRKSGSHNRRGISRHLEFPGDHGGGVGG